jgi:hypothetical protein
MYAADGGTLFRRRRRIYQKPSAAPIARSTTAAIVPPAITAVLFPLVGEDMSEPKLAVSNEIKPDLVRVDVSVEVVWEVLIDVGSVCTAAATAVPMGMQDVEVACNATALELAADRE